VRGVFSTTLNDILSLIFMNMYKIGQKKKEQTHGKI
jgi:hypothetical protein